jgi:hypothetical protein
VRAVDLALFADALAGEAASLGARAERARSSLRQWEIERAAKRDLPPTTTARLETLGILSHPNERVAREELAELACSLEALQELQVWVEARLAEADERAMPA